MMDTDTGKSSLPVIPCAPSEPELVKKYLAKPALGEDKRSASCDLATKLLEKARASGKLGLVERLMSAYSLSSDEGRMLMELAESLLRVPDKATRDALIHDKIAHHGWLAHGDAGALIKAAGMALHAADAVLEPRNHDLMHSMMQRLGTPVIRSSILAGMRMLGTQFVLATNIEDAVEKARKNQDAGYSFDMLGEAARTDDDAVRFFDSYAGAIKAVATIVDDKEEIHKRNGISVKLSALDPRFHARHWDDVLGVLWPRLRELAQLACEVGIPLTIDAEESARMEMTLGLARKLAELPELAKWNGLGMVVQAYDRRAGELIEQLDRLANETDTRIAIRLVKGAYWDSEIKTAQEKGLSDFAVYTNKNHTDLAYLRHARSLFELRDVCYPQFATHNAVTLAAMETLAQEFGSDDFEVQRLQGMGEAIHEAFGEQCQRQIRIYAPVGGHDDLLAYLVRRLLENSANASFLHQFSDLDIPIAELAQDPYTIEQTAQPATIPAGTELFSPERPNSKGWDLDSAEVLIEMASARATLGDMPPASAYAPIEEAADALRKASEAAPAWSATDAKQRAAILDKVADAYERETPRLLHLLAAEAGKTIDDAVSEVREAVDFCRYYAACSRKLPAGTKSRGTVLAISPWNFPLAIFTGQVTAALGAGNAVIAKPAEQTSRIAAAAVELMHEAGVPADIVTLLPGTGEKMGAYLSGCGLVDMVVFTGSTETARNIHAAIARSARPWAPLLAETGGINAMIVDATALLERVVDDVLASGFRSAGQRCSALRMLYVQEDIYAVLIDKIVGAAKLLRLGDPADFSVEIGPVIDEDAKSEIDSYLAAAQKKGSLLWQGTAPKDGLFCAPAIVKVEGVSEISKEVFGPVLHVASYGAGKEEQIVADINASGYGLTFGMHSRINEHEERIADQVAAGNVYINRNQIGAVVGSQPFGGHGLSGTGPKAGGPLYLPAFTSTAGLDLPADVTSGHAMPGPSGEENRYQVRSRGQVLCISADKSFSDSWVAKAEELGNAVTTVADVPDSLDGFDAVVVDLDSDIDIGKLRKKLIGLSKQVVPLITDTGGEAWLVRERHLCINLTASGGNIALLAQSN